MEITRRGLLKAFLGTAAGALLPLEYVHVRNEDAIPRVVEKSSTLIVLRNTSDEIVSGFAVPRSAWTVQGHVATLNTTLSFEAERTTDLVAMDVYFDGLLTHRMPIGPLFLVTGDVATFR